MRIALLSGPESKDRVTMLANGLRERGVEVVVIHVQTVGGSGWLRVRQVRTEGQLAIDVHGRLARWAGSRYPILLRMLRKRLTAALKDVTVIHAFGLHPLGAIAWRLAQEMKVRLVLSPLAHELLSEHAEQPYAQWSEAAMQAAHPVIVESDFLKARIPDTLPVQVIAPFLQSEGPGFRPRPMGSSFHVVMHGAWENEQPVNLRPKLAMKALAQVEAEVGRPVILSVMGGGSRLTELAVYTKGLGLHAHFHGALDTEALSRELQRADLFLHAADFAIFPEPMLQALRCGIPVVASDVEGMAELLGSDANGLLVGNKLSLWKDGILQAARQEFDHYTIAASNRGRYSLNEHLDALLEVYRAAQ
jgi:glycosyltransferase involved in cell wall biosynthesis